MRKALFLFFFYLLVSEPVFAMSKTGAGIQFTSEAIGVRTYRYFDESRGRPVIVELWYPTHESSSSHKKEIASLGNEIVAKEPTDIVWIHPKEEREAPFAKGALRPLIMMSHGHLGDRRERSWLADVLTRQGYIVASVEHFGNTWYEFNPVVSLRFWERAKDVSFALDRLLEDKDLFGKVDVSKIGFVGYSLGGMTGLGLAGAVAQSTPDKKLQPLYPVEGLSPEVMEKIDFSEGLKNYREDRIRAMLLICPANFLYPPESLKEIKIPIGLIASIQDEVLPHREHAHQIIKALNPLKLKLMRNEISHYAFLNRVTEMGKKILNKGAQNDPPCCDRSSIHREVGAFAIEFFKETLP